MENKLLKCPACKAQFDLEKKLCKILPCSCVMCLECLQEKKNEFDEYTFECSSCKRKHHLFNLDTIVTSKIISHLITNSKTPTKTQCDASTDLSATANVTNDVENDKDVDFSPFLKEYINSLAQSMKIQKADVNKHYDATSRGIDERAERLIEFVHQSRATLQDQMNKHRNECLLYGDVSNISKRPQAKPKFPEITKLENDIDTIIKKRKHDDDDVEEVRKKSIKLQHNVYDLKKQSWYFAENTLGISDTILGRLLTENQDKNYVRIRNLKTLLASPDSLRVNLQSEFKLKPLRQETLPLSKHRLIKIYFSTSRSLHFELFDTATGKSLKSLCASETLSSFPVSCGYGDHFCVSFASRSPDQSHLDSNTYYVQLYDLNLNLVKSVQRRPSIESLYMNESCIIVHFSHLAEASCEVFDYKMNVISRFGQQINTTAPFYLEKSSLSTRQQMGLNFRINARIFGFTDECIYLWNYHKCFIICRKKGIIVKSMDLHGSRPYFLLDSQKNIIQVNNQAKKIALYNQDFELLIENVYSDNLDTVHINKQGQMAFADMEKNMVVYI